MKRQNLYLHSLQRNGRISTNYGEDFEGIRRRDFLTFCTLTGGATRAGHTSIQRLLISEFFLKNSLSRKGEAGYLVKKFWPMRIILRCLSNLLHNGIQTKQKGLDCWKFFR